MNHHDLHPEDLLRGRVVDRTDGLADWDALERLAAADPTIWLRLARDLRLDCEIRGSMGPALACARAVDLSLGDLARGPAAEAGRPTSASPRSRGFAWVGWAAALLMTLVFWFDRPTDDDPPVLVVGDGASSPSAPRPDRSTPAWQGSAAASLPGMLVRATPEPSGDGMRVVYVHRELREATVDEAFSIDGEASISAVPVERYETPTEF